MPELPRQRSAFDNPRDQRKLYVDGPYGQMHVRLADAKEAAHVPLYCIHQSPSSSVVFVRILEEMCRDRTVAAGDTPGFGESDHPSSAPEIEDYARAHGAVIDQLGLDGQVDLFGYYTGARIAVALALLRPGQIRRLVLFGAPVYEKSELAAETATYDGEEYYWDGSHLMDWWEHLRKRTTPDYPLDLFVRHFIEIQRGGPDAWWGHRAAFNYPLAEYLPKLTQPVTVIATDDPQGERSRRAIDFLQRGELVILPFEGQGLLDLHTDDVCKVLRKALD